MEIGTISRRQVLKLGAAAGAATAGALSPAFSRPARAAGLDKQIFFNVVDATQVALIVTANVSGVFLRVEVLPSRFVNGVHVTFPDEDVPGPAGLWPIPLNETTVIPIPTAGVNYDFSKGGFAAVRALALDQGGNPGAAEVLGYVALNRSNSLSSVSGSALEGTVFVVPVPPGLRKQLVTLCLTPLANAVVLVRDAKTNAQLFPAQQVNQNHTLVVATSVEPTALFIDFSGGSGICSALIRRGPNGTRRLRLYPTKVF